MQSGDHLRVAFAAVLAAVFAVSASCSSDGAMSSSSVSSSDFSSDFSSAMGSAVTVPIDVGTTTTMPASEATTTVASGVAPGFELGVGGIGAIAFGELPDVVMQAVSASLGSPISDIDTAFPTEIDGLHVDEATGLGFARPVARTVCWPAFCAFFGGDDPADTAFVGWDLSQTPAASLSTVEQITVGTRWSDVLSAMTVQPGGCPTSGFGATTSGVELRVGGGAFSSTDGAGEYVELLPDPSVVVVTGLAAGSRIIALEQGC